MIGGLILFLLIFIILLMVIFSFSKPTDKPNENKIIAEETNNYQENKEWFAPYRWLIDEEIDWAIEQIVKDKHNVSVHSYKFLAALDFMYVRNATPTLEADSYMSFPLLLSELTSEHNELVFIPVNNPDFHWSLLVYETKSQCFYHYDTLKGANYEYVKPLVKDLLQQIHQINNPNLTNYLIPCHDIHQHNGYDCGVAVISIIKRISEKYQGTMKNIQLGEFDFKNDRKKLRNKYLTEKNDRHGK